MGIVFRQSAKTLLITFSGALLGAAVIYCSTKLISKQELGFSRTITNAAVIAAQLLLLGFQSVLSVYIYQYPAGDQRRGVFLSLCFGLPMLAWVGLSAAGALFRLQVIALFKPEDQRFIFDYFYWLPLFILLFLLQMQLEQYLSAHLKLALSTFIREIVLRVVNIVFILLFGFGLINFSIFIAGTVLSYLVPVLMLSYFAVTKTDGFRFSFAWSVFSRGEFRALLHFAWYHSLLMASLTLLGTIDGLMLPVLAPEGLRSVAVYTVALFILSLAQIPYKAMLNAAYPIVVQAYKDGDMFKVNDLYIRSSENMLIASLGVSIIIACNLDNGIATLPQGYEALKSLVLILLLGRLTDMCTGMNDQIISISSHYKFGFYLSVVLVIIMVILYRLLIPIYGIYGAAWGSSIALIVYNIAKVVFVWKKLGILPLKKHSSYTLVAGAVAGVLGYFLPRMPNTITDILVRSSVILLAYGGLLLWLKPSDDLVHYIASVRKNKRLF